jgi:hypothetical protein
LPEVYEVFTFDTFRVKNGELVEHWDGAVINSPAPAGQSVGRARSPGAARIAKFVWKRRKIMRRKAFLVSGFNVFLTFAVFGQNPGLSQGPSRIVGTIESLNGQTMVVKSEDGQSVSLILAPDIKINTNTRKSLSDIKPGEFVGSAAVKKADGALHAEEVHVFPENMRGTAEGQNPMGPDPARNMTNAAVTAIETRSMTNATVSSVKNGPQGGILKLKYEGGEAEIEVGPDVPVIALVPADASLLKPGAAVIVFAFKTDKGQVARFMSVEKDGFKPVI